MTDDELARAEAEAIIAGMTALADRYDVGPDRTVGLPGSCDWCGERYRAFARVALVVDPKRPERPFVFCGECADGFRAPAPSP